VTAARENADRVIHYVKLNPVAVEFDFMNPAIAEQRFCY
jgi:hypothetical protein